MSKLYSEIDAPITMYDAFGSPKTFKVENHIIQCDENDVESLLQLPYVKRVDDEASALEFGEDSDGARGHKRRGGAKE